MAKHFDGLRQRLDKESSVLFGTARLWDDGIIDPRDTRRILGLCLALAGHTYLWRRIDVSGRPAPPRPASTNVVILKRDAFS